MTINMLVIDIAKNTFQRLLAPKLLLARGGHSGQASRRAEDGRKCANKDSARSPGGHIAAFRGEGRAVSEPVLSQSYQQERH
jgi:hypothetical protein